MLSNDVEKSPRELGQDGKVKKTESGREIREYRVQNVAAEETTNGLSLVLFGLAALALYYLGPRDQRAELASCRYLGGFRSRGRAST